MKIPKSAGIHSGIFHADEVTACAFLLLFDLIDEKKIVRTRDPALLATCEYVCDVGGVYDPKQKLFDHHQATYQGLLSSAGMVLNYLKEREILNSEEYLFFNNSLVKGVDEHDNGRSPQHLGYCTFSHVIANFGPISYDASDEELDQAFFEALHFTLGHLRRLKERFLYGKACLEEVGRAMQADPICLFFERSVPWLESFFALGGREHSALFIIMPAQGHWKLRGIPPDYERRMQVRLPLPEEWAGLLGEELQKKTGIEGAIFCHKGRFTSVWKSKEDAITALRFVLKKNGIVHEDTF